MSLNMTDNSTFAIPVSADANRDAATNARLDQTQFFLTEDEFIAFERILAQAPKASEIADKLKIRPSPWKE